MAVQTKRAATARARTTLRSEPLGFQQRVKQNASTAPKGCARPEQRHSRNRRCGPMCARAASEASLSGPRLSGPLDLYR